MAKPLRLSTTSACDRHSLFFILTMSMMESRVRVHADRRDRSTAGRAVIIPVDRRCTIGLEVIELDDDAERTKATQSPSTVEPATCEVDSCIDAERSSTVDDGTAETIEDPRLSACVCV